MTNMVKPKSEILFQPISDLFTLKTITLQALNRLNITILRDLLFYQPISYQVKDTRPNLSKLTDGQLIQTEVIIQEISLPSRKHGPIKIGVYNSTGSLVLIFFNQIPPFIFSRLKIGSKHVISGRVKNHSYYFQMAHPEFISPELNVDLSPFEPIYPLTYGLTNKQLHSYIVRGLELASAITENTIQELISDLKILHLCNVSITTEQIENKWQQVIEKLATQELLANQILLNKIRTLKNNKIGHSFDAAAAIQQLVLKNLQFQLTTAQQEVIQEIELDQQQQAQMMRLLQGDVGSGKTLVALVTMLNVISAGYQTTLMTPTDLLSVQHYQFFKKALHNTEINIALLTGHTPTKERKHILTGVANGTIKVLIGTHALFQESVNFYRLGYIIIDEQHRFGVAQRLALINKSSSPDVLIMTATPIPRSLTLTMFGDMLISKLHTKPQNRLPIITTISPINKLKLILNAVHKKIIEGKKIYWVCPLIDQNDKELVEIDAMDVHSRYADLRTLYGNKIEMLHGKMTSEQKNITMQKFTDGDVQILVATTVIEIGIDVPAASLMIIENAEKFGLAQLHQLRGRVGRGNEQSYCIMLYNPKYLSNIARQRLEIMRSSSDGFYIAEQDLILRGSGEILGLKQSGEPEFFFANLNKDLNLLVQANKSANDILDVDFADFQVRLFAKNVPYCST